MTPPQVQQQSARAADIASAAAGVYQSGCWRRNQLQRAQGVTKTKRNWQRIRARPVTTLRWMVGLGFGKRVQARPVPSALETAPVKKEAYRRKATTPVA